MPATVPAITALADYTESINLLAYGDPGCGKTVLAGTVGPQGLIIACEPGTISAKRQGSDAWQMRCENYGEFAAFLNTARRGEIKLPNGETPSWYVIDTLTELQQMMIRHIMQEAHKRNAKRSKDIPDMPGHQEWQVTMKRVVRALNDLPQNVLYLCHAMYEEDEEGERYVLPDLAGKNGTNDPTTMSRYISGTVHAYGLLKPKDENTEDRVWVFKASPHINAKDRYGVLAPQIENPNILEIQKLIDSSSEGN